VDFDGRWGIFGGIRGVRHLTPGQTASSLTSAPALASGPMPTIRTWLVNFKIYAASVIVSPIVGVLFGICSGYLSQVFNLGLINIRFPEPWSVTGAVSAI
jgi:uncharacterized membrane protein